MSRGRRNLVKIKGVSLSPPSPPPADSQSLTCAHLSRWASRSPRGRCSGCRRCLPQLPSCSADGGPEAESAAGAVTRGIPPDEPPPLRGHFLTPHPRLPFTPQLAENRWCQTMGLYVRTTVGRSCRTGEQRPPSTSKNRGPHSPKTSRLRRPTSSRKSIKSEADFHQLILDNLLTEDSSFLIVVYKVTGSCKQLNLLYSFIQR